MGGRSVLLHDVFEFHARARPVLIFTVDGSRAVIHATALDTERRVG